MENALFVLWATKKHHEKSGLNTGMLRACNTEEQVCECSKNLSRLWKMDVFRVLGRNLWFPFSQDCKKIALWRMEDALLVHEKSGLNTGMLTGCSTEEQVSALATI